jgi:hypothetical protein
MFDFWKHGKLLMNLAFSSGAERLRGYVEPNKRIFPPLKTPRRRKERDNIEPTDWMEPGEKSMEDDHG